MHPGDRVASQSQVDGRAVVRQRASGRACGACAAVAGAQVCRCLGRVWRCPGPGWRSLAGPRGPTVMCGTVTWGTPACAAPACGAPACGAPACGGVTRAAAARAALARAARPGAPHRGAGSPVPPAGETREAESWRRADRAAAVLVPCPVRALSVPCPARSAARATHSSSRPPPLASWARAPRGRAWRQVHQRQIRQRQTRRRRARWWGAGAGTHRAPAWRRPGSLAFPALTASCGSGHQFRTRRQPHPAPTGAGAAARFPPSCRPVPAGAATRSPHVTSSPPAPPARCCAELDERHASGRHGRP